jgi:cyanophycinase-like exopeptidase
MTTTSARTRVVVGLAIATLAAALAAPAAAVDPDPRVLVPIGSDYLPSTLQLFAREAAAADDSGTVHILVLPITYSLSADGTTKSERKKNLSFADNRRGQVEAACVAVANGVPCDVDLVPVLVRSDAVAFDPAPWFDADLDGMYVLGGDQTVAMNVVHDTPLEAAMTAAYEAGAVLGGNSAGAAVQSRDMINGYTGSNGPVESLRQGAVELCRDSGPTTCEGGLAFGFPDLITDQHVFERGRMGRSLNVSVLAGEPVLGVDAATGAVVTGYADLRSVTGDTAAYVIDPVSLGGGGTWAGPNATLRAHDVAVHVIPPGDFGFDLDAWEPVVGGTPIAAPSVVGRTYPGFASAGTGPLLLSGGGLAADPAGPVGAAFVQAAGGAGAHVVVLAAGYARNTDAMKDAKAIAAGLGPSVASTAWFVLDGRASDAEVVAVLDDATGVVLVGRDRSIVGGVLAGRPAVVAAVVAAWEDGAALLGEDAGAAVLGGTYVAEPVKDDVEAGAMEDATGVDTATGLGLVALDIVPRLLPDLHWPQLLQLASRTTATPAAGIDVGTALVVDGASGTVVGGSAVVVIDSSRASWGAGANGAPSLRWLILDSFVDGDMVAP